MYLTRPNTFLSPLTSHHRTHNHPPKSQPNLLLLLPLPIPKPTSKPQTSCSAKPYSNNKKSITDAKIAWELAREMKKMNTRLVDTENAINRSREFLFEEMCKYLDLQTDQAKKSWRGMSEEEKWCLVDGFVCSDWSIGFRPLSGRCVKDLVDEYVGKEEEVVVVVEGGSGGVGVFIAGLRKLMGL